jgi:hypothetical protein
MAKIVMECPLSTTSWGGQVGRAATQRASQNSSPVSGFGQLDEQRVQPVPMRLLAWYDYLPGAAYRSVSRVRRVWRRMTGKA